LLGTEMWILLTMLFLCGASGIIPLLILKTSRSGSAWMANELNTHKGLFLTEELIRGESYTQGNAWKEAQAFVEQSFLTPQRIYGQEWDDEIRKPEEDFKVLGVSLDTLYVEQYLNWTEIGVKFPNLKLVVYQRSNIVKHAVSRIRKGELLSKCGLEHVKEGSSCTLDKNFHIKPGVLGDWIIRTIAIDNFSFETAFDLAPHLDSWFYILDYEELVHDEQAAIQRLFKWIGWEPKGRSVPIDGRCRENCTKITSDDLKNAILNYEEVESYISNQFPCLLSHLRETNPGRVMHSVHMSCSPSVYMEKGKEIIQKKLHFQKQNQKEWEDCCLEERDDCNCSW